MRQAAHDVADPSSSSFRKYLTPSQFAATYGAPQPDYQSVVDWAKAHGLTVDMTYPNRLLVDVSGTAEQVEQALYVGLNQRLRPDGSTFYAIDRDPSLDLGVTLLWISGLDNRVLPTPGAGSGPGGTYSSSDLRAAYASCTNLTGAGQSVGLFELDDFFPADIAAYECQLGGATCTPAGAVTSAVPNVVTTRLDNASTTPTTVNGSFEVALDIEMTIGMAPGLAQVQVFEAPATGNVRFNNDILDVDGDDPAVDQPAQQFVGLLDGQQHSAGALRTRPAGAVLFQTAGDQGSSSWTTDPSDIRSLDAVTVVGGTTLTMNGSPPAYGSKRRGTSRTRARAAGELRPTRPSRPIRPGST